MARIGTVLSLGGIYPSQDLNDFLDSPKGLSRSAQCHRSLSNHCGQTLERFEKCSTVGSLCDLTNTQKVLSKGPTGLGVSVNVNFPLDSPCDSSVHLDLAPPLYSRQVHRLIRAKVPRGIVEPEGLLTDGEGRQRWDGGDDGCIRHRSGRLSVCNTR